MAILLAGLGLFIYLRFESQLDGTIDQGLRSRADDVAALVSRSGPSLRQQGSDLLTEREESFAQILSRSGTIVDSSPQLPAQPLLRPADLRRAERSPTLVERTRITGIEEPARLLASPIEAQGRELVVVVGSALDDRDDALASLGTLLLIGGPAALLLASLAGYGTAVLALRPVEAMRRRASEISADEPEERLPLPGADDELRRLGETLNAMLARLEAALERERAFVDDASHELRTPLALHKAELELGLRYAETAQDLRAAIASAIEEVDRLVQLAEDLLVVARSAKGRLALSLERVAVTGLFETVRERFSGRAAEAGRPLVVEPADGLVVDVDRLRVEQALTNLVDNALRYGDGEVRLWAGRATEGVIELHVSDRGPGFPPEFLPRAFERFARADAGRARGGTGLGLAIVDAIADAHRGTARAVNLDPGVDVAIAFTAVSSPPHTSGAPNDLVVVEGDGEAAEGGDDGDD